MLIAWSRDKRLQMCSLSSGVCPFLGVGKEGHEGPGPPRRFRNNENKFIFNKNTIKLCNAIVVLVYVRQDSGARRYPCFSAFMKAMHEARLRALKGPV